MDINIRLFKEADWKCTSEIYQYGMDTNLATFQIKCPDYKEWNQNHLSFCRLVAEYEKNIVGFAVLSSISSRCVYSGVAEVSIYIAKDYIGHGIGTILLQALIDESETHKIWTLQSSIMSDNLASIRLHERCGFRTVGIREKIGCDRLGNWRDTLLMERRSKITGI